ncbi:T-cell receptor gamma alternate reading frame protein [Discoglossus pictus]
MQCSDNDDAIDIKIFGTGTKIIVTDVKDESQCNGWIKVFGSGTKLIVNNTPVKPPSAVILSPSKEDIEKKGEGIYLCHLHGFYPDVIKVSWVVEGTNAEWPSDEDEIKNENGLYNKNSWITVSKRDLDKTFLCKYKHEGVAFSEQQTTKATKKTDITPELPETVDRSKSGSGECPNSTAAIVIPTTYQAASLTYTLLLVKSCMYSLILLFLMYRTTLGFCFSKRKNIE